MLDYGHVINTVIDTLTDLMWEVKTANNQYRHQDLHDFVTTQNKHALLGFPDWRIPTIQELYTLVDYKERCPMIDLNLFPKTQNQGYWSCTLLPGDDRFAYIVDFTDGTVLTRPCGYLYPIRLVRSLYPSDKIDKTGDSRSPYGHID